MKKWLSEVTVCEICHKPMGKYFYDGSVDGGAWGLMCEGCWLIHNGNLGIGIAQKYLTSTKEGVDGFKE